MKINIPRFVTKTGEVYFGELLSSSKKEVIVPQNELLKESLGVIEKELYEENNEARLLYLTQKINYWLNYEEPLSFDIDIKDSRTLETEKYKKGTARYPKKKEKEEEKDCFFEMFGYDDRPKEEVNEVKPKKQRKKKQKKEEIKREPEVIQEELNDSDLNKIEQIKKLGYNLEKVDFKRLYHSTYKLADFKQEEMDLVLLKFKKDYLLTNSYYLEELTKKERSDNTCMYISQD